MQTSRMAGRSRDARKSQFVPRSHPTMGARCANHRPVAGDPRCWLQAAPCAASSFSSFPSSSTVSRRRGAAEWTAASVGICCDSLRLFSDAPADGVAAGVHHGVGRHYLGMSAEGYGSPRISFAEERWRDGKSWTRAGGGDGRHVIIKAMSDEGMVQAKSNDSDDREEGDETTPTEKEGDWR